jgi:putative copper export protein
MPLTLLIAARSVQIGASLLLMGIFTFDLLVLRSSSEPECGDGRVVGRLLRLAWWSAIAGLLSDLLWFAFEVTSMTRLPLAAAFSTRNWRTVLFQTRFGHVWQLRLSLIVLSLFLIGVRRLVDRWRKALTVFLWLLMGTLLVSLAWISHPAAASEQPLGCAGRRAPSRGGRSLAGRATLPRDLFGDRCWHHSAPGCATLFLP